MWKVYPLFKLLKPYEYTIIMGLGASGLALNQQLLKVILLTKSIQIGNFFDAVCRQR